MIDEERADIRASIFEAVTAVEAVAAAVGSLQRHLDEQFGSQIRELQSDVSSVLEKLDSMEIDLKDTRTMVAKMSREQIQDRNRDDGTRKRLLDFERRLSELETKLARLQKGPA
jgi:chromosome segregation ATPase